jgi:MFS family permease
LSASSPFSVRSFRFQWSADLATSWAFEMETLILGWYVLEATGSVKQLVLVAALVWLGSLFSPFFGVLGDRVGVRTLMCVTRGVYALLAATLAALALGGALVPWHVFAIAALSGLLRPSDMALRNALVGQTMPAALLLRAIGISRTTTDTARIAGALTGTAGVALVGMGPAYAAVAAMYVAAFLLTLGAAGAPPRKRATAHPLADLLEGFVYVWRKPDLLGAVAMAFLTNLLAYPFILGLLPYVANQVFAAGQAGLGYLAATYSAGALAGSLFVGSSRLPLRAARAMLWSALLWFVTILLFGQTTSLSTGLALLFFMGFVQSFCMTPLAVLMLRSSSDAMRGRVMGVRQLAVWGLPLGLLASGYLIERFSYVATTVIYSSLGLAATLAIAYGWRHALWHRSAQANVR